MNYYNIQYSPEKKKNNIQRLIYDKKIKIYGSRKIKQLNSNNEFNKQIHQNDK